jgi:hypothetical protein
MAIAHDKHPEQPTATLKQERIGCGIDDHDLDTVLAASRMAGNVC